MAQKELRALLDTNVWSSIAGEGMAHKLEALCRRRHVKILIAPSVVYEALRTNNVELRSNLATVMCRSAWHKLMPEAFDESDEFVREVRRARPTWLRNVPELPSFKRQRADWLEGRSTFWGRVRRDPSAVASHIRSCEGDLLPMARQDAMSQRQASRDAKWAYESTDLSRVLARMLEPVEGWDGDDIQAWRIAGLCCAERSFLQPPHRDWIHPFVELRNGDLFRDPSWVRFWLYDADVAFMPRWWIRSACEILQSLRKGSDGTPCDAQLATYLLACDTFYTCDRVFAQILDRCRDHSPRKIGRVVLVSGTSTVDDLFTKLEACRREEQCNQKLESSWT